MTNSSVGIFWGIPLKGHGWVLLSDRTAIELGELYGDHVTHSVGHYEFWERAKSLGQKARATRNIPELVAMHEYEDFPRGRVVYHPATRRFVIYADRRLHTRPFMDKVIDAFGIPKDHYSIRSDPHYQPTQR